MSEFEENDNSKSTVDEESIDEENDFEPNNDLRERLIKIKNAEFMNHGDDVDMAIQAGVELVELKKNLEENYSQEEIENETKLMENQD